MASRPAFELWSPTLIGLKHDLLSMLLYKACLLGVGKVTNRPKMFGLLDLWILFVFVLAFFFSGGRP